MAAAVYAYLDGCDALQKNYILTAVNLPAFFLLAVVPLWFITCPFSYFVIYPKTNSLGLGSNFSPIQVQLRGATCS